MEQRPHMPIREFSRLTGIRRENLRFYDQIGLLSPETRKENGYRYYAWHQIESALLIGDLRALDVSIEEIKQYMQERSPERMLRLFEDQEERIQKEIERLHGLQDVMRLRADMARQAMRQEGALLIEQKESEPIFLVPTLEAGTDEEKIMYAYDYADAQGVNLSYPLGIVIAQEHLAKRGAHPIHQCYFKGGGKPNACKPAGVYAVAYGRSSYWATEEIYNRLLTFIPEQGYRISGNAYEEYPLDELSVAEGEAYGVRVEICVSR